MNGFDIHESEYKWIDVNTKFDAVIRNEGTIGELQASVLHEITDFPR